VWQVMCHFAFPTSLFILFSIAILWGAVEMLLKRDFKPNKHRHEAH
jgi:hypothetical protein